MFVILMLVAKILLGFSVGHFLWRDCHFWPCMLKFSAGIPLGMGISSLLFFCWLWLALPRPIYPWLEILLALVLFAISIRQVGLPKYSAPNIFRQDWAGRWLLFLALGSVFLGVGLFSAYSIKFPHGFFEDAWFIWNMTARFLFRSADWTLMFRSESLLWHPDYPLLLSLNVVQGWLINGGETTAVPILIAGLFTFSIPAVVFAGLMMLKDLKQAALAVILLLTTPWFVMHGTEQVADVPVSAYFLCGAVFLFLYIRQRDPGLCVLAGLMAGLSAWTKNEGIYFWLSSALISVLIAIWIEKKPRAVWSFLAGSLLPLGIVLVFKLFIAPGNDLFQNNAAILGKITDLARHAMIITEFSRYISEFGGWPLGIFWVLLLYAIVTGFDIPDRREMILIALLPLLLLAGYYGIYLITPRDLYWHLTTSLGRLLTQIFPLLLFVLMLALNSPQKLFSTNSLKADDENINTADQTIRPAV